MFVNGGRCGVGVCGGGGLREEADTPEGGGVRVVLDVLAAFEDEALGSFPCGVGDLNAGVERDALLGVGRVLVGAAAALA